MCVHSVVLLTTLACVIYQVTVFKNSAQHDPRDLSTCDLDVAADVARLRVMVVFRFLGRVQVSTPLNVVCYSVHVIQ